MKKSLKLYRKKARLKREGNKKEIYFSISMEEWNEKSGCYLNAVKLRRKEISSKRKRGEQWNKNCQ